MWQDETKHKLKMTKMGETDRTMQQCRTVEATVKLSREHAFGEVGDPQGATKNITATGEPRPQGWTYI